MGVFNRLTRPCLAFAVAAAMLGASFSLAQSPPAAATRPDDATPSGEVPPQVTDAEKLIIELQQYYADLYGRPDNFETRLGGLIAVISLNQYAGDPLDDRLLKAAEAGDELIAQAAWDALAGRYKDLTAEQRSSWQEIGLKLATGKASREAFLSYELQPLLLALAERPVGRDAGNYTKLIEKAIEQNDADTERGKATLEAAGQALAAWGDKSIVNRLLRSLRGKGDLPARTAIVLSQLPNPPQAGASDREWSTWARDVELTPTPRPFDGKSLWFPPPVVITDAENKDFRKEMELPPLKISSVDVVFCIDATGSMKTTNDYVIEYFQLVTQTLSLLSSNISAGAVYYRHETKPELQKDCCRLAVSKGTGDFLVDTLPLTRDLDKLVRTMALRTVDPKSHDEGAYTAGLEAAGRLLGEGSRKNATRVIAMTGDAKLTPGSEETFLKLATLAHDAGILLEFVVKDAKQRDMLVDASKVASQGEPLVMRHDLNKQLAGKDFDPLEDFETKPFGEMAARVIASTLPPDYKPRTEPVVQIVGDHMHAAREAKAAGE